MNILLIKHFFVGFMVSEIPRVSVFGYFPLSSNGRERISNDNRSISILYFARAIPIRIWVHVARKENKLS